MEKENTSTTVTKEDLQFIKEIFTQDKKPVPYKDLARKLAFKKNSGQLKQKVKIYDPRCDFEIGDLIYKEYDELLLISSKGTEPFQGAIVLKVVNKIKYESFQSEMLEVDYSGGGTFRKYIDYMKKTKIQVLLPSNQDNQCVSAKFLEKDKDPRLHELPMTEKELKMLEKHLVQKLSGSKDFFSWNEFWQLKENQVSISDDLLDSLQTKLKDTKESFSSSSIISQEFGVVHDSPPYDLHWISLNHTLDKQRKKFILVSQEDGGKWQLKEHLDSCIKGLPLCAKKAKVPSFEKETKPEARPAEGFPLKLYLSWREIHSGGVIVPKYVNKELSSVKEYVFKDMASKKEYVVYYYPTSLAFIGLKEFYKKNNVPQGASLTLKRTGPTEFLFTIKTIRKRLEVPTVTYDTEEDKFSVLDEIGYSFCSLNKIIFLEKEILERLFSFYDQYKKADLKELLLLIMENFSYEGDNRYIHSLRAFHLVDLLKRTTQEDIDLTLANSPEFMQSDKQNGLYFYQEPPLDEEMIDPEAPLPTLSDEKEEKEEVRRPKSRLPEIGTIEGDQRGAEAEDGKLRIIEEVKPPVVKKKVKKEIAVETKKEPLAAPITEIKKKEIKKPSAEPAKPKKAKEIKKKGRKIKELDRSPRRRKGVKKIREEQLKLEESEMEALFAIKTVDKKEIIEDKIEETTEKKKIDYKTFVQKEEPTTGIFAAKLKTALTDSKKEKEKNKSHKRRRRRQ